MSEGRNNPNMFLLMVFLAAAFAGVGFWYYNNSEGSAFHETLRMCKSLESDIARHEDALRENELEFTNTNDKVKALELELKKAMEQIEVFRDQVQDTREKQIQLKSDLAGKTTRVILPKGPIPVEIYTPPKPGALMKKKLVK